jgi:hypothetical protein
MDDIADEPKGITHTLVLFGIKYTLIKTQKGYRGNYSMEGPNFEFKAYKVPLFQGYTFKQALNRMMYKALHQGFYPLEDYNNFVGMSWKTPMDIQVWGSMNRLTLFEGKHYFNHPLPAHRESEED